RPPPTSPTLPLFSSPPPRRHQPGKTPGNTPPLRKGCPTRHHGEHERYQPQLIEQERQGQKPDDAGLIAPQRRPIDLPAARLTSRDRLASHCLLQSSRVLVY